MAYSFKVKQKAKHLRKKGYSIKEVSEILRISKSTASVWLDNIKLNSRAKERLQKRRIFGQYKAQQIKKINRKKLTLQYRRKAFKEISSIKFNKETYKLFCALLFWCEGAKNQGHVEFINSDPIMIKTFMSLFRSAFEVEEKKLRILMHLHEYHNEKKAKKFLE